MEVVQESQQTPCSGDVGQASSSVTVYDPCENQSAGSPSVLEGSQENNYRAHDAERQSPRDIFLSDQQPHDLLQGSHLRPPQTPRVPWTPQTPQAPLPSHVPKSPAASYFSPLFAQSTGPAAPTFTALPSHPPPSSFYHNGGGAGSLCDNGIVAEDECIDKDTNCAPLPAELGPGWEQILLDEARRRFDPQITALRDIGCVLRPRNKEGEGDDNDHDDDVRMGGGGGDIKIPKDDMGRLILLVKKDCTIGYNAGGGEAFGAAEGEEVVVARAMPFIQVEGNLRMQITGGPQQQKKKVKKRKRNAEDCEEEGGQGGRERNDGDGSGGAVYGVPVCDAPHTKRPAKRVRIAARRNVRRQAA
ncbi:uncharacterized protein F4812DRAFT_456661 [Daldinia caldariorum]|uniref:uncharacterized protein n=1 Tax=Daldinia caldariorum TaxID=326644 RepID=UPI002007C9AF|nr:uncharacterized protein F4812DRAFT_456661 [Daldinia caldariorum]KAI1470650.1 hypothetical protein F4812DRAFT_456661 [Daldinia caldariorum]